MAVPDGVDALALALCLDGARRRPEQRSPRQLERLAAIGTLELAGGLTEGVQPALQAIVEAATPLLDCRGLSVILWDAVEEGFVTSASTVDGQPAGAAATRVRRSRGATRFILESGHGLHVRDIREDPFTANPMLPESGSHCYVGLPVRASGEVVGVLYAMGARVDAFDDEDVELLAVLADRSAVVIQAAQEYQHALALTSHHELVARAAQALATTDRPDELLPTVLEWAAEVLALDHLALVPRERRAGFGPMVVGSGPIGWAVVDHPRELVAGLREELAERKALVVELVDGRTGLAHLVALRRQGRLDEVERRTLEQLAALISSALRRVATIGDLEASNEALARFAHVVSHDLRSPLANVAGLVEVVLMTEGERLSPDGVECAERAVASAHRMGETIRALLDSAAVPGGRTDRSEVPLGPVVEAVLEDLDQAIRARGAKVEVGPLPVVWADAAALRVVLQNLVSNALKFARPLTTPHVTVSAVDADTGVQIVVADDGIGVDDADRERVFRLFDRGSDVPASPGHGIGLSTVARIVEAHGGRVWLEPNEPTGTVAVVELPHRPVWLGSGA